MGIRINVFFCVLISGPIIVSNGFADENTKEKYLNLQKSFLNITEKSILPFVHNLEISDFPVSLDELKIFSLNVNGADIYQINHLMLDFFYFCFEGCNDFLDQECHSYQADKLYNILQMKIDENDTALLDKKSEHCKLLIAYFASCRIIKKLSQ